SGRVNNSFVIAGATVTDLDFGTTSDRLYIATGSAIRAVDTTTGETVQEAVLPDASIDQMVISSDRQRLAVRQVHHVSYWELPDLRRTGDCRILDVRTIAFAPRSDKVGISVGSPNAIRLDDIRAGRESDSIGEGYDCINSLLIMPDGAIV